MLNINGRNTANNEVSKQNEFHSNNADKEIMTCPVCGVSLTYSKLKKTVVCDYCLTSIDASDAAYSSESFVMSIDSPDSAMVYVENFFKDYDWDNYKRSSIIEIPGIKKLVEKHKIKFGASASSWILDFYSKIFPVTKKLESLPELEGELLEKYAAGDKNGFSTVSALYERSAAGLKLSCDKLFTEMENDIANAAKLGADKSVTESLSARLNGARKLYDDNVRDFVAVSELPSVQNAEEVRRIELYEKFRLEGVDAENIYVDALDIYENYEDKSEALRLFGAVENYDQSEEYINKINTFFDFDNLLFKLSDKHFLVRRVVDMPVFTVPKKKKQKKDEQIEEAEVLNPKKKRTALALYEIIGGRAYEPAVVNGISCTLNFYSNKLFYIKRGRSICSYDIVTHKETELDRGISGDYLFDENNAKSLAFPAPDRSCFFIRKKLSPFIEDTGRGCIKSLLSIFKRNKDSMLDIMNNYSLLKIDMENSYASVEIDKLVDVTECYKDRMFYITYEDGAPAFMLYDLKTGKKTQVLSEECEIYDVIGDTIVYSTWNPTEYNKTLCTYDLSTATKTVIEENVFEYFKTIDSRLYYGVGNTKHSVLFSNDILGESRTEIAADVKEIIYSFDGWIYVTRKILSDETATAAILKISCDGKKKLLIAPDVKVIVDINDTYIYYTDSACSLHTVYSDGNHDRVIASDVVKEECMIIDKDYVYYLCLEAVSDGEDAYSLYRTGHDGKNTKKLLFNVDSIKNYDKDTIYAFRNSVTKYIATTTHNEKDLEERTVYYNITQFFTFDKNTEESEMLVSLGLPSEKTNVEKRGCFRKKITHRTTYVEASEKAVYRKAGIAKEGDVYNEQTSLDEDEEY